MFTGCNTLSFAADREDWEAVELLVRAGFTRIDLNLNRYGLRKPESPFWLLSEAERLRYAENLRRKAESLGALIWQAHSPFPTFFEGGNRAAEVVCVTKSSIAVAAAAGARYVVVHSNVPPSAKTESEVEAAVERNFAFFSNFFDDLKRCEICIGIENLFNWCREEDRALPTVASTAEAVAYMTDRLNEMCGDERFVACLDTGHAMLTGGGDLPRMVRILGKRLRLLHIHDNDARRDRHLLPFEGVVDWSAFAKALAKARCDAVLSLEVKTDGSEGAAQSAFAAAEKLKLLVEGFLK